MESCDIRIVLVAPSHPGNIGAAARAMKNMALTELVLVSPRQFPHAEANARGAGRISTGDSRISVWVIPTNEELMIARHTTSLLKLSAGVGAPA